MSKKIASSTEQTVQPRNAYQVAEWKLAELRAHLKDDAKAQVLLDHLWEAFELCIPDAGKTHEPQG